MWLPLMLLTVFALPAATANPPASDITTLAETELAKLPGHTGFAFCELTPQGPKLLSGVRQDERFAIGSGFKLFILGRLIQDVNEDRRGLDNVMRLRADLHGPPHSEMAEWPLDSPVTLYTLALKMISISDNTATDHLHYLLGRENIEHQMVEMGVRHPEWNEPLLSTREMTMLRDKKTGLLGNSYLKLDEPARREFLAQHFQGVPDYDALDFETANYEVSEWYATPLDMASVLDWIRLHTEEENPASSVRKILAVDPKMPHDPKVWPFIGFKGGSEDQMLAGNWLMLNKNGKWYTLSLFYNNPDGKAEEQKMVGALGQIFSAITKSLE